MPLIKKYFAVIIAVLIGGGLFAWYQVITGFIKFYGIYQTLFRIKDCALPNPVTTPCFYGAIGFIVAIIWAVKIYRKSVISRKDVLYFTYFMIGCTIFGFSNVVNEFYLFSKATSGTITGCSGLITNPWQSPCLIGSSFYLLALLISVVSLKISKNQ